MIHISPGVYVKIIDQSAFINAVPVTTVFVPFFSDKGVDNELVFINGQKTLRTEFSADLNKYTRRLWEGWMCLDRWLSISGSSYGIRLLPNDATYANILLGIDNTNPQKPILILTSLPSMNTKAEIETVMAQSNIVTIKPIFMIYAFGRGEWYNNIFVNFTPVINEPDIYSLDVYENTPEGLVIVKTFKVSLDPEKKDLDGDSVFIEEVLEKFSTHIRAKVNLDNFKLLQTFATENPVKNFVSAEPSNPIQGDRYIIGRNPTGAFSGKTNQIAEFGGTDWTFTIPVRGYVIKVESENKRYLFDGDDWIVFDPVKSLFSAANINDTDYKQLQNGSSGSLFDSNGNVNINVAKQLLVRAYSGLIDAKVLNMEYVYFPFVLCPYPFYEVSDAAVALSKYYREDCITFTTLPDSTSPNEDIETKKRFYNYNTFRAAIYGNYSKVYNMDLGRNIWVSPIYHMARIMPYTVKVASIADAPAGFERAICDDAKDLRYYPEIGDRDNLYIERINYIAQFRNGTVIWQQLTSQMKDSALSDINVVNTVLYITRTVKTFCNNFIYYRNTPEMHEQVQKAIDEFLKDLKDKGWIRDYNVEVGATELEYKQKIAHVNIILYPTKVVEKFIINAFIRE